MITSQRSSEGGDLTRKHCAGYFSEKIRGANVVCLRWIMFNHRMKYNEGKVFLIKAANFA